MQKNEIISKVNEYLVEEFELEENQITPEARLRDDLEIQSLDFVDIAVIIEKEFGFKLAGEDMVGVITLEDLYNLIYDKINNN